MNPRGCFALFVFGLFFFLADVVQRTLVVALIKLRPSARRKILRRWLAVLAALTFWVIQRVGGARIDICEPIRSKAGTLVVVNHQSLIDIPIAVRCIAGGYPMIIARDRYRTGIPLISHMIRLFGHPTVRPGQRGAEELRKLREFAETTTHPVVIFPEGSRSRDGEIRPFRTSGLKTLLSTRSWTVYLVVIDGLWKATSIGGFVRQVSSMRVTVRRSGPIEFDPVTGEQRGFIASLESQMRETLDDIRGRRDDANPTGGMGERAN